VSRVNDSLWTTFWKQFLNKPRCNDWVIPLWFAVEVPCPRSVGDCWLVDQCTVSRQLTAACYRQTLPWETCLLCHIQYIPAKAVNSRGKAKANGFVVETSLSNVNSVQIMWLAVAKSGSSISLHSHPPQHDYSQFSYSPKTIPHKSLVTNTVA